MLVPCRRKLPRIACLTATLLISTQFASGQDPAAAGKALFTGLAHFQNGGPPCITCHSVSSLPYPKGGTLGPDLTGSFAILGPEGMDAALETLFFPTMVPIYDTRPLTADEQRNLKAFLAQAGVGAPPTNVTPVIVSTAIVAFLFLLGLAGVIWRDRLRDTRRMLVQTAQSPGGPKS